MQATWTLYIRVAISRALMTLMFSRITCSKDFMYTVVRKEQGDDKIYDPASGALLWRALSNPGHDIKLPKEII